MKDTDLEYLGLNIVCPNAYDLAVHSKDQFILLRRNSIGASDSSIILGVNPFTSVDELINRKCSMEISKEELEVGEKENVRKGADLEPLILKKFEEWSGIETYKPDAMYQITDHPQLTVNFDGIICLNNTYIPAEAKFVSTYANKYWDRTKAINAMHEGFPVRCAGRNIKEHILESAEACGIPPYYYTQVQQQLLALKAPFGYLAALFDKGWEFKVFKIFADVPTQTSLIDISTDTWNTVQNRKGSS
jgi:hypothetical protein